MYNARKATTVYHPASSCHMKIEEGLRHFAPRLTWNIIINKLHEYEKFKHNYKFESGWCYLNSHFTDFEILKSEWSQSIEDREC
jgi:hypothetical protein